MWPPTTHGLSLRYCSETPRTHKSQTSGARVSKRLLILARLKFCYIHWFSEKPYTRKPWQALTQILNSGISMPARVSKRLLTLAHAFIIHSCSGVCDWCLTFLFARSACSAFTENDSFPANHGARWNSLSEFAYTVQLLQRVASRLSSPSLYPAWWPNTSGFHQKNTGPTVMPISFAG